MRRALRHEAAESRTSRPVSSSGVRSTEANNRVKRRVGWGTKREGRGAETKYRAGKMMVRKIRRSESKMRATATVAQTHCSPRSTIYSTPENIYSFSFRIGPGPDYSWNCVSGSSLGSFSWQSTLLCYFSNVWDCL